MSIVLPKSPKGLFRQLLRMLSPLPKDAQKYYKHRIKQVHPL